MPPDIVIAGRYAGVIDLLAKRLEDAGHRVRRAWAADRPSDGPPPERTQLAGAVLVVLVGPADPTLPGLQESGALDLVAGLVAVTWHPDDEQPAIPAGAIVVRAGAILAQLPTAVWTSSGLSRPSRPR